jgi:FHA domain
MTPAVVLLIVRVALAVCLYAFLSAALVILWRDLRAAGSGRGGPVPGAHLTPTGESGEAGVLIPLLETNLLGRAADNSIRIDHATVSSHHARIAYRSGRWILEDLGSRNGTRVNGIAVEGPMVITYGDALQFGEVLFVMRAGAVSGVSRAPGSSMGA